MKKVIIVSLSLLFFYPCFLSGQEYNPKDIRNIHSFLTDLHTAALEKDTVKLKKMIYSVEYGKETSQSVIIKKIILNDENSSGDFSFSIKAFNQICDSLYTKFAPISDELLEKLIEMPPFNEVLRGLEKEEIPILYHINY